MSCRVVNRFRVRLGPSTMGSAGPRLRVVSVLARESSELTLDAEDVRASSWVATETMFVDEE